MITINDDDNGKVKFEASVDLSKLPRCNCKGRIHGEFMLGAHCPRCVAVVELPPEVTPELKPLPESFFQSKENKMNNQQNNPEGQQDKSQQPINPLLDFPVGGGDQDLSFNFLGDREAMSGFGRHSYVPENTLGASPLPRRIIPGNYERDSVIESKYREAKKNAMEIELFFAQYLLDIGNVAPLDGGQERNDTEKETIFKIQDQLCEVRNFTVAQTVYRISKASEQEDPFFGTVAMPVLIPIVASEMEIKYEMPLTAYVSNLAERFPEFRRRCQTLTHLSSFGSMVKVCLAADSAIHYLVIPKPEEFVAKMIEFEAAGKPFRAY